MRKILLLVIVVILLLPGAASAQADANCGTLTPADCTLLAASQTAMAGLKSAAFDLHFTLHAENLGTEDVEILAIGSGAYHLDARAWNNRLSFANNRVLVRYLAQYLSDVSASLNLTISAQIGSDVEAAALQMRLVDSVGYFNFGGLRSLLGDSTLSGWGGLQLEAFLRLMLDQDPHVFDGYLSGGVLSSGSGTGSAVTTDSLLTASLGDVRRVKTAESGIAAFETRIKLSDFFDDPVFAAAFSEQLEQSAGTGVNAETMIPLMQMLVGDSELVMQQRIRVSDYYLDSLDLSYDLQLARFVQSMMFPDLPTDQPVHFDFNYNLAYDHFNDAPSISIPDNVLDILDYAKFQRLFSGGSLL